ncbi:hypothetical protein LY474_33815 [Myxococcus stipitatus]|uniref:hypothetical protein n=1 Tax=Myxococcus stipitatus TaxID=83455 RepID=UPI001F22B133|nr:hypothetical protein [Myxococcus stipitatus]MCE9672795.1 hypothetical protein [Myxococcus stipitatus]
MRVRSPALLMLVVGLSMAGCAKNVDTRVAGDDDAAIDGAAARLEELRARAARDTATCEDRCDVATRTCDVAEQLCTLVDRHPDRDDLPPRCARGREQCSDARSGCSSCQNG